MPTTSFDEWLQAGIDAGYCTAPACVTHEGIESVDPGLTDGAGAEVIEYDEWCYFATLLIPMTGEPPA
jgi:hypothetical protein